MERREFLKLLGSGALAAMLVPSVAEALKSGKISPDEVLTGINTNGGDGFLIVQEAKIVGRVTGPALNHGWVRPDSEYNNDVVIKRLKKSTYYYNASQDERILRGRGVVPVKNGETIVTKHEITDDKRIEKITDNDYAYGTVQSDGFVFGHQVKNKEVV